MLGVDGDGGDAIELNKDKLSATKRIVLGISTAASMNPDVKFLLVGNEESIKGCGVSIPKSVKILGSSVIPPKGMDIRKHVKGSSLYLLVDAVKSREIQGFFSIGGTERVAIESLRLGRVEIGDRKVKPCLVAEMPSMKGIFLFTDVGATTQRATQVLHEKAIENLASEVYFQGLMTAAYAKSCFDIERQKPRLGVFCNGTESYKGSDLTRKTVELFEAGIKNKGLDKFIDFYGRAEPKDATRGKIDVFLTDGFTGNASLKFVEAMLELIAFDSKEGAYAVKKRFNPDDYNCAPVLGLDEIVGKAHGTSSVEAITKGANRTIELIKKDVVSKIKGALGEYSF